MKKLLLTLSLLTLALSVSAQIAEYEHPCTIMGQEVLKTGIDQPISLDVESLIIHDVDDNIDNPFKIKLLKGENYTIDGDNVIPKSGFQGIIEVNTQVLDGNFTSNIYPVKIQVGECNLSDKEAIYVATDGNDNNSGTKSQPIATLQRAKELVKTNGAQVVYFREGEYFVDKSVKFNSEDSGEKNNPIIYTAYPGEKVRFTGSVKLDYDKFEKAKPNQLEGIDDIYIQAKIKVLDLKGLGITKYGEIEHVGYAVDNKPLPAATLVVDGSSMHLSRYPNVGNFDDVNLIVDENSDLSTNNVDFFDTIGTVDQRLKFKTKSGKVLSWRQTGDIWVDGSLSKAWEWKKNKIAKVEPDSTITMTWEYNNQIGIQAIKMFYFNIFEELDFPEEYFIDREKGLLFVYFPDCVSEKADIRLTQSDECFIELDGADYLSFENIIFEGSRNSAIVTLSPSSYNTFLNCEILSCGLDGISIDGYGNEVRNCVINNVGGCAISMVGGDYQNIIPACNIVENCKIHDFAQERRAYHSGLAMSGLGQISRHNEIYNGPHMAARISGSNHIVEYCDFHDAPNEYSDMLGVYMCTGGQFFDRGTIIRRNKFHDVTGTWKQSAGVYLDNESNGNVVEENYIYDNVALENGWSVMIHGGCDNAVRRNVFVDCSYPFRVSTRLNGYASSRFEGILKRWEKQAQEGMNDAWRRAYPELLRYFDDGDKRAKKLEYKLKFDKDGNILNYWNMRTPDTNMFFDNLVYNKDPETFVIEGTSPNGVHENRVFYAVSSYRIIDGVKQSNLQHRNNHNVTSDPGFIDYKNHNLQVDANAEIIKDLPHLKSDYYNRIGTYSEVGVR